MSHSREVLLVRHAHAEWPQYTGADFDRPLTARGLEDAARTGAAIAAAGHRPARLLASPARRTRQTAALIAAELGLPENAIHYVESLYNASAHTLEVELRLAAAPGGLTLLVAHNPGVSELARQLSGDRHAVPFSPAAWRHLTLPIQ